MNKINAAVLALIVLLSTGLFAGGLQEAEPEAGKKIPISEVSINQAPGLREKVAAGELPILKDRLPEVPKVESLVDGVGKYGGTIRTVSDGGMELLKMNNVGWTIMNHDLEVVPDAVQKFQVSEGGRIVTYYMRKGMKWSDGTPFTSEDIRFWWNNMILNETLTPVVSGLYRRSGEVMKFEVVDNYTFRVSFVEPYQFPKYQSTLGATWFLLYQAQYLKQFHPDYAPMQDVKKAASKAGFENWQDFFWHKASYWNPEKPVLGPYITLDWEDAQVLRAVRNPYHFRVDTEGNQLPYIDELMCTEYGGNTQATLLEFLAGKLDYAMVTRMDAQNYDMLVERAGKEEGGFSFRVIPAAWQPACWAYLFSFNSPDPLYKQLFNDKRFRVALSVAMDRQEMNKIIYNGLGGVTQVSPPPGPPWNGFSGIFLTATEYDPVQANRLLDELGLTKRGSDGFRLRPDGTELNIIVDVERPELVAQVELHKKYLADVGLKISINMEGEDVWALRQRTGQHPSLSFGMTHFGGGPNAPSLNRYLTITDPWEVAPDWAKWVRSDGAEGVEPPPESKDGILRLKELQDMVEGSKTEEEYRTTVKEMYKTHMDNLWIVNSLANPLVALSWCVSEELGNVADPFLDASLLSHAPWTWYFKD